VCPGRGAALVPSDGGRPAGPGIAAVSAPGRTSAVPLARSVRPCRPGPVASAGWGAPTMARPRAPAGRGRAEGGAPPGAGRDRVGSRDLPAVALPSDRLPRRAHPPGVRLRLEAALAWPSAPAQPRPVSVRRWPACGRVSPPWRVSSKAELVARLGEAIAPAGRGGPPAEPRPVAGAVPRCTARSLRRGSPLSHRGGAPRGPGSLANATGCVGPHGRQLVPLPGDEGRDERLFPAPAAPTPQPVAVGPFVDVQPPACVPPGPAARLGYAGADRVRSRVRQLATVRLTKVRYQRRKTATRLSLDHVTCREGAALAARGLRRPSAA
jgi:hypothetical protein